MGWVDREQPLPPYYCCVMNHNTCCNNSAGSVWGHSEAAQAREAGLQYAKCHLYPDPGSGTGHAGLYSRVRIGGYQKQQAGTTLRLI